MFQKANSDIITHDQLVEEGAIRDYLGAELEQLVAYLPTVKSAIDKFAQGSSISLKAMAEVLQGGSIDLKGIQNLQKELKNVNDAYILNEKVIKAKAQSGAALAKQEQEELKLSQQQIKANSDKQRSDEKSIKLTNEEIAKVQLDNQKKKDTITLLKAELIEMDKTIGTLQRVEAANTRLRIERKNLNAETTEGKKRLEEINKAIDKNNEYIKENSDQLKKQKLNVGNYANSIKEAFAGTGILGDSVNKYLGIITLLSEKIEGVVSSITKQKEAQKAATAVTEESTVAQAANKDIIIEQTIATEAAGTATIVLTEAERAAAISEAEAAAAAKINAVSLDTQTVATETAEVATKGLAASLKALATNPYVIAAVAIAALAKVVYDNVTATQAQKDAWDAGEEGLKAYAKAALVAGVDAKQLAADIRALTLEEFKRQDLAISALTEKAKLRAEAAQARSEAMEEGKTTKQRIVLLQEFVDKTRQANEKERQELELDVKIKQDIVTKSGKIVSREQRRQLQEAIAALSANQKQTADETRKANKQITTLTDKYYDDTKKMLQDAQKEEIEQMDTFSQYKAIKLNKELAKSLALNKVETDAKVANLKEQQKKLGEISPAYTDEEGIFHAEVNNRKEFNREIQALINEGKGKAKQETEKTNEEIAQLNIDFQEKSIESERKFREDLAKLDEAYNNLYKENVAQEQANDLQKTQFAKDNANDKIKELREQRDYEISTGKEKYKLSTADLKKYFDVVEKLEDEHYVKEQNKLNVDAQNARENAAKKLKDDVDAVHEKYRKLKEEQEKGIRNKEPKTKAEAEDKINGDAIYEARIKKQVADNNINLSQNEATEIEGIKAASAEVVTGINDKLNGALDKSDQDHLKNKKATAKEEKDVDKDTFENRKKLLEEERQAVDQITEGIKEGLQKRSELQQSADQKDIDFHKRTIDVQATLAAAGKANTLATEQAAADKAEEKKLQDQKRAIKEQETVTLIKTFSDTLSKALEKDEPFIQAFAEATAASGIVSAAFAKLFTGFFEGTDSLGEKNTIPFKNGKDDVLISAKKGERIVGYEDSKKIKGLTNKEVVDASLMYMNNGFKDIYIPQFNSTNISTTVIKEIPYDQRGTAILAEKLDSLQKAVANMPHEKIEINGLVDLLQTVKRGNFTERYRYKIKPRHSSMWGD